jgi:excisionase family DNA binding protein
MSDLVLYTSTEVAELLRLNTQVVQRKLQAGEIPGYRIGREWRIERRQLLDWLERHSNQRDRLAAHFAPDGRLRRLPAKRSERRAVLERIATSFEPDRTWGEVELNAELRRFHDDVAALRRELVAEKLFIRSRQGVYKRTVRSESLIPLHG